MKVKSKFILPAVLVSTAFVMTYFQYQAEQRYADFSAFKNLTKNLSEITTRNSSDTISEDNLVTQNIIKTIDRELSKKIAYKLQTRKRHIDLPKTHIATKAEEINNNELIELRGIEFEKKSYQKFDNVVVDEVKIAASATAQLQKIEKEETEIESGPIEPTEYTESENEMPMFEYSQVNAEAETPKQPYDAPLSPTVKKAISRVVGSTPIKLIKKTDDNDRTKKPTVKEQKTKSEGFVSELVNNREYRLSAFELNLDGEKRRELQSFNFTPDYDREERIDSSVNGLAKLQWALAEGVNTQTGIIEAQGMLSTRVEINLSTHDQMSVPMISEEEAEKLYPGKNLLLLAIDSSVADTEIDSNFAEKILFNKDLKKVETVNEAHFVLYAGVKNGNILLKYYLSNKETAQKVIYVGEREMYFEEASFASGEREIYSFQTRHLMSSKKTELSIAPDLITVFNTGITSKKRTLNSYELKMPTVVSGSRKYLEMKHLNDSIFVGTDLKLDIDVPSNEFIAKVLEVNQINSLKEHCVVQINISKELSGFTVNGKNHSGEMYTETSFLNEEGQFSKTDFEYSEKAFVVGDMEGIFAAKLEYSDGSTQFLKTFCSEGTYIVEQL